MIQALEDGDADGDDAGDQQHGVDDEADADEVRSYPDHEDGGNHGEGFEG